MTTHQIPDRGRRNRPESLLPSSIETRETIEHLIACRQALKDFGLDRLNTKISMLEKELQAAKDARVIEEVSCHRDIQKLHKRLIQHHDEP